MAVVTHHNDNNIQDMVHQRNNNIQVMVNQHDHNIKIIIPKITDLKCSKVKDSAIGNLTA